jgi:hypothetical protein
MTEDGVAPDMHKWPAQAHNVGELTDVVHEAADLHPTTGTSIDRDTQE